MCQELHIDKPFWKLFFSLWAWRIKTWIGTKSLTHQQNFLLFNVSWNLIDLNGVNKAIWLLKEKNEEIIAQWTCPNINLLFADCGRHAKLILIYLNCRIDVAQLVTHLTTNPSPTLSQWLENVTLCSPNLNKGNGVHYFWIDSHFYLQDRL